VSWAKGFGGGVPIGAIWADDECAGALGPGTHGSTFGGTPLISAVSLAVLEEIENRNVLENVTRQADRIRNTVSGWKLPPVVELRGVGLMLGFVLNPDAFDHGDKTAALSVVNKAMEAGMLTVPAGERVVRWLPRLDVPDAEVDEALSIFHDVLESLT
jgi:acetylornithine/succinyldiaminopimelate/putrescine aminotransferase